MATPFQAGHVHLTTASGTALALPSTVTIDTIVRRWRNHVASLARGGDVLVAGPYPQSFELFLRGKVIDASDAAARTRIDNLLKVLADAPLQVRVDGASAERYLLATPQDLTRTDLVLRRFGDLSVRLLVPTPYWMGDGEIVSFNGLTSSPSYRSLNGVAGNLPTPPVVSFTFTSGANVSNPSIINVFSGGTREFLVPGTFGPGDTLVVDTERMRVYDGDGVSYLDQMGDEFLLEGWPLNPGNNSLSIYGSGTVRMDVDVAYQPRWS